MPSQWVDIPLAVTQADEVTIASGAESSGYTSQAELVNLMLRPNPPGSRTPFHISHVPALSTNGSSNPITTPGTGFFRGLCFSRASPGRVFVIRGSEIYYASIAALNSWTLVPTGSMPGSDYCRMVDAGTHVVAVDGNEARAITTAESFALSRSNFTDVAYQDGFTVFTEDGSDSVYSSNVDDPTTIGALNFTTADALPGRCIGIVSNQRELFVIKNSSIEYFQNVGASGFPFARSSPGVVEVGCYADATTEHARMAIAKHGDSIFWVGHDKRVYRMRGYRPEVISTPWVDRLLRPTADVMNGGTYVHDGALFYFVGIKDPVGQFAASTMVCDVERGLWHKRTSPLTVPGTSSGRAIFHAIELPNYGSTVSHDKPRANVLVAAFGLGDATTSTLYTLDHDAYNDSGASTETVRTMTLPQYSPANGRRVFMHELELDMQKASAATTCTLQWSDDGGTTYNTAVAGTANLPRVRWQRLGSFRQRTFRFNFAIASKLAIMGVRARIEVGE